MKRVFGFCLFCCEKGVWLFGGGGKGCLVVCFVCEKGVWLFVFCVKRVSGCCFFCVKRVSGCFFVCEKGCLVVVFV